MPIMGSLLQAAYPSLLSASISSEFVQKTPLKHIQILSISMNITNELQITKKPTQFR